MSNCLFLVAIVWLLAGGVRAEIVRIDLGGAVDKQVIKAADGGGTPQHFGGNPGASHAYVETGYNDGITVANGLPTNHLVTSPSGLGTYQLLSYTSDLVPSGRAGQLHRRHRSDGSRECVHGAHRRPGPLQSLRVRVPERGQQPRA